MIFLKQRILESAIKQGAQYCDIRFTRSEGTSLDAKDGELKKAVSGIEMGAGIRVLYDGAWGFFSTNDLSDASLDKALQTAMKFAKNSSKKILQKVEIGDYKTVKDKVEWKPKISPLDISIEEKHGIILEMDKVLHDIENIQTVSTGYSDGIKKTHFTSSEGTDIETEVTRTVAQLNLIARKEGNIVSYRTRLGGTCGFELFDMHDYIQKCMDAGKAAIRILDAKTSPSGRYPVIVDPDLAGVFVHEALGHAAEGDIVNSGDSILENKIGHKIASEIVSVADDPTVKHAFGSFPYDDEGVKAEKKVLIEKGVLKTYILDRENAAKLGLQPNGGARAESYAVRPLVRMSNTYIEAGDRAFEELLEGIKFGIYTKGTRGGQVDTAKGSFQFSAQEAFLIENGEITSDLKDVSLSGLTLEILNNIDAVGKDFTLGDPGFCGKGQLVPVGDGGPHIRIKEAIVGGSR